MVTANWYLLLKYEMVKTKKKGIITQTYVSYG